MTKEVREEIIQKTVYIAHDGKEFATERSCKDYEQECLKEPHIIKVYNSVRYKCITYQQCLNGEWENCVHQPIIPITELYPFILRESLSQTYIRLLLPEYISHEEETKEEFQERMMYTLGQRMKYGKIIKASYKYTHVT